ncbi:MAG: aminoglycoside 3'-phosphotransferase [Clostridia bacterium]|nr:aminoglycoside 3'-phosphotransferase [Clostridia bacterium]
MSLQLPAALARRLEHKPYIQNTTGLSGAGVLMFDDCVLKTAPDDQTAAREARMMAWLEGKLPVPRVLEYCEQDGTAFLLMSRLEGEMSCEDYYMERPQLLCKLLAEGLKALWQVDIRDCPCRFSLDDRLLLAEDNVRHGRCEVHRVEPDTYGPGGFRDPEDLLRWLKDHRPPVDEVLSHGDFCLPNVFFRGEQVSGYLDLGFCAAADRYQDIALCYRSLLHNADGTYGPVYPDVRPDDLFRALGMPPDWEKVRYYRLLDELF